jgi:hypothetical protein
MFLIQELPINVVLRDLVFVSKFTFKPGLDLINDQLILRWSSRSAADASPLMSPTLHVAPESSYPDISLSISKREYLLAQIRQKDAIIESLLKQVSYDFLSTITTLIDLNPASQSLHCNTTVYRFLSHGDISLRSIKQ